MTIPLEPSDEQLQALIEAAGDLVRRHVGTLGEQPSWDLDDVASARAAVAEPPPETGRALDDVLRRFEHAASTSLNTAGPGYLAYIPGGGLITAAIADLLADATNRYTGLAFPSPALVELEGTVTRWLCDLFGFPTTAVGILTTGGSMANLSAIVTARHTLPRDAMNDGTIYATAQTHHSVAKAAFVAGFTLEQVRIVPTDDRLRMDPDALAAVIARDRAEGRRPFCVVASAGTTNTGAVDPMPAIADLARAEGLWLHVDAAYGGFFWLTDRGRDVLAGITRADSITLDPHKGMFLPYGTGALLVRDGSALRAAHTPGDPVGYLQDLADQDGLINVADYGPELSRDFRGLRVWLPLQLHGVDAFRQALTEKLELTAVLTEGLRAEPTLEVLWEPELSVVAFVAAGGSNDATRALLERINASKRIFCSSTVIDGRFIARACIVSHRTHRDRIDEAIEIITAAARAVAG